MKDVLAKIGFGPLPLSNIVHLEDFGGKLLGLTNVISVTYS